jgi:predicted transcriptional regulator
MSLNQKAALTILLTILTISVSFIATTNIPNGLPDLSRVQHFDNLHQLTFSVPIVFGASLHSNSTQPLNQPTRIEITTFIKSNPGVHFRGICDSLGLSVGVVQYHLNMLERAGIITGYNDGQYKRYFEQNTFTQTDMKLISLVRHETTAKILTILSQNGSVFHKDIASILGISSQALTWQMNQLKNTGLINAEKTGINVKYSFNDANVIKLILNLTNNLKTS